METPKFSFILVDEAQLEEKFKKWSTDLLNGQVNIPKPTIPDEKLKKEYLCSIQDIMDFIPCSKSKANRLKRKLLPGSYYQDERTFRIPVILFSAEGQRMNMRNGGSHGRKR